MTPPLQGQGPTPTAAPTVGDTIWVARTVAVPAGTTLRPADWDPPDPIQRLGPPRLTPHGDSTDIAYPIVVWRAGPITVSVPGPLLLTEGGRIDSVPPRPQELQIASVLPTTTPVESLAPQPRADFVPRTSVTPIPLLVLLLVAAILLAPRSPCCARCPRRSTAGPTRANPARWQWSRPAGSGP